MRVLPSIKANLSLAVRRVLTRAGAGCDTFGPGELHAALTAEVPPNLISVNGSTKSVAVIEQAVAAGARITLDSAPELDLVEAAAARLGTRAHVRLRLRPDYDGLTSTPTSFPTPTCGSRRSDTSPASPLSRRWRWVPPRSPPSTSN